MSDPACVRVPLKHYPGMNRLVLDWISGETRAARFLPSRDQPSPLPDRSLAADPQRAALAQALAESNQRWGLFVKSDLQAWAAGQTVTIVAGQQVGFAGGPIYTLAKIATLLKMKRDLEKRGTPVTALFWLATEDHDFDEIARLTVPVSLVEHANRNRQLDLISLRATRAVESKRAVGNLLVPDALIAEFLGLFDLQQPEWLRDGITFRDSFAELIAGIFGNEIILVDSMLPELRRAGSPLFAMIREKWTTIQSSLLDRSQELESAGYPAQVARGEDDQYTLLFEIDDDGTRRIIGPDSAPEPERTSTSALTRPLLQDFVLRPDIFVGGPAEVAYYAQIAPLHELLGVSMPRVALRGHALLVPGRVLRILERFNVKPEELFSSPDALLAEREPESVAEVKRLTAEGTRELMSRIEKIGEIALPAEHAMARAVNRSIGHIEYHFEKLAERAIKSLVRKEKERFGAASELIATLHPDKHVQDRVVAWFPFWLRYQQHVIDRLIAEIEPDAASFAIVGL